MAITVAFDGDLMHDMGDDDSNTGVANAGDGGGGAAPGADPDFVYQGSNSMAKKVGTTRAGIEADTSAFGPSRLVDVTALDRNLYFFKIQASNKGALLAFGSPAMHLQIGSSDSTFSQIEIAGNEPEFYPLKGGWVVGALNLNLAAFQSDDIGGGPTLTAIDYFAVLCDFGATSKADNVFMDAIHVGLGHTLIGSSPDGTIQDFVDFDQGTIANRMGCFVVDDSIVKILGMHWIGRDEAASTTLTVFNDIGQNIVFPDGHFGPGNCGFSFDLGNGSTDIDLNAFIITGVGRSERARFDTEDDVDATPDEITLQSVIDAFRPGDAVIARSQGGTESPGLVNGTRYWVGKDMVATPTGITLHTSRDDAALHSGSAGGTPVALTASSAGNGEIWRLDKDNDTRPQLIVVGTAGALNITGGTFTEVGKVTLTSACDVANGIWNNSEQWTQAGGRIDSNTFNNHNTIEAEDFILVDDLADIVDNAFDNTGGRGHAIRATQTGSIGFVGNTFAGYFAVTNQLLHQFDNTTDVDAGADGVTLPAGHGYVTGDPIVYSKVLTANTAVGGLTDETLYYLGNITGDQFSLHLNEGDALNDNARIALTVGTGNETHALWPANAAFFNDSGGALTLGISGGGATPSVRNALDSTTAADVTVTLTVQVNDENGDPVEGAKVRIVETPDSQGKTPISQGTTDASGTYTDATFVYSGDVGVTVKVRDKSFKFFRTTGTIVSTGFNLGVRLEFNDIVDLP